MPIQEILDHAYEEHIGKLFESFIIAVSGAENQENEINAAAERFKTGVDLAKDILEKAKQIVT